MSWRLRRSKLFLGRFLRLGVLSQFFLFFLLLRFNFGLLLGLFGFLLLDLFNLFFKSFNRFFLILFVFFNCSFSHNCWLINLLFNIVFFCWINFFFIDRLTFLFFNNLGFLLSLTLNLNPNWRFIILLSCKLTFFLLNWFRLMSLLLF